VILLVSIPIGLVAGFALGGRLDNLAGRRFVWAPLAIIGLLAQLVLFSPLGGSLAGPIEPTLYIASTAAVFVAVLRNIRMTGLAIVALGALSNLAAIVANGGAMPADPGALATAGLAGPGTNTNSVVVEHPALQPLTDIFAIPAGVPLANVFSVGDLLIGLGVGIAIAAAMRRPPVRSEAAAA
jgi:Family of unknown function (DUF5317)